MTDMPMGTSTGGPGLVPGAAPSPAPGGPLRPIIEAHGLVKTYGKVVALDHSEFELYPGEILAVIGDNGAGKSSLIKAICGAITPDEGEIKLEGKVLKFRSPMDRYYALEQQTFYAQE